MSHKLISATRICIIGNQAFSLINFRGSLIAEMVAQGFDVFALAPDYDDSTRNAVRALNAEPVDFSLSRTGMNPMQDIADMLRLAILLRKLRPSTTLAYAIKPVIYGTLASWIAQVPMRFAMIEGLGYIFSPPNGKEFLKRRALRGVVSVLYAIALRCTISVFFLNKDDIEEFSRRRIIQPEKAFLLGGIGVDLVEWPSCPPVTKPVTFLLVARLLIEKGIVEYAMAARIIKKKHKDARIILVGSLDANPGALSQDEIDTWVNEGILEWPGRVPDVRSWMAKTSVFVLPSYYREGVPRSIQEAMSMARPIISSDSPGCRETVINGKNGFLVPAKNAEALAEAMAQFITNPQLIARMGQASRKMAEERFDVHKVNQMIIEHMGIRVRPIKSNKALNLVPSMPGANNSEETNRDDS